MDNIKYVVPFNELFVGATRTISDLIIFSGPVTKHKLLYKLFESIISEYSGTAAAEVSDMTLKSLISYIQDNKKSYNDTLLLKYLSRAVENNNTKAIKALVKAGADVNLANQSGYTALLAAVNKGHKDIVEFLAGYYVTELNHDNPTNMNSGHDVSVTGDVPKNEEDDLGGC